MFVRRLLVWGVLAALLPAGSLLAQNDETLGHWKLPDGLTPLSDSLRVLDGGKFAVLAGQPKRSDRPAEYFLVDLSDSSARRLTDIIGQPSDDMVVTAAEASPDGKTLAIVSSDAWGVGRIHCLKLPDRKAFQIYASQERLDVRWVGRLLAVSTVGRDKSFQVVRIIDSLGSPVKTLNTRGLVAAGSEDGKVMLLAADPVDGIRPSSLVDYDLRRMHLLAVSYSEQTLMDLGPIMEVTRRPAVSPSGRFAVFRKEVGPASNAPAPTLPAPDIKLVFCDLSARHMDPTDQAGTPLGVTDGGWSAVYADSRADGGQVRVLDSSGKVQFSISGVAAASLQGRELYTLRQSAGAYELRCRTID